MGAVSGLRRRGRALERPPLEVMVARVFNPIGPGTPATQALGRFASRLAEPGQDPLELAVGDLDSRRDFIDVRDVARAMVALATRGKAGLVYHVGTGQSHRVGDGLERLAQLSGRVVQASVDPVLYDRRGPLDSRADIGRIIAARAGDRKSPGRTASSIFGMPPGSSSSRAYRARLRRHETERIANELTARSVDERASCLDKA